MPIAAPLWLVLLAPQAAATPPPDPRDLVLRSTGRDAGDMEQRRHYTYVQRVEEKRFDKGALKSAETEVFDVTMFYGQPYRRLIEKNGKPLSASEARKEQEKMDREVAKRSRESDSARAKRLAEERKELEEEKAFRREVADAFVFTMLPEQAVSGIPAYVIRADPRPGYRPRTREGKVLPKVRGTLWISKQELRWVKMEAEFIDTFSLGWFLLRVAPGTRLHFEARRVAGPAGQSDLWMPQRAHVRGQARLAGVKKYDLELNVEWSGYKRFQTESRIVAE